MATFTWVGNHYDNYSPYYFDDPQNASNWSPAQVPGSTDTVILNTGAQLEYSTAGSFIIPGQVITASGSVSISAGQGVGFAAATTLSQTGTLSLTAIQISIAGTLLLSGVANFTVGQGPTVVQGTVEALSGATVTFSQSATMENIGGVIAAIGGNLTLNGQGTLDNAQGVFAVGQGGRLEIGPAFTGGAESVVFSDAAGTLVFDNPGSFSDKIEGFQTGDTIDLSGFADSSLSTSFANDTLTLRNSGTVVTTLRFDGQGLSLGSFAFSDDGVGGTDVTVAVADPTWRGTGTTSFDSAASWSTGTVPGVDDNAIIAQYGTTFSTLVASGAESIGSLMLATGTLTIAAGFGVARALSLGPGAMLSIGSAGALTTSTLSELGGGSLSVSSGGHVTYAGATATIAGNGRIGLDLNGNDAVSGGTISQSGSGGAIVIGDQAYGTLTVSNGASVTAGYTQLGQYGFGGGSLVITGASTSYTDAGGDGTTNYTGAMLVGGGGFTAAGTLAPGGSGTLLVDQGATLTDTAFAVIADTTQGSVTGSPASSGASTGMATVSNGAHWIIQDPGSLPASLPLLGALAVGVSGTGTLDILSGGTVGVVGQPGTNFAVTIGQGGTNVGLGTGLVLVSGTGSKLDAGGGPIAVGQYGYGTLDVAAGGTVLAGAGPAGDGFSFGVVVGDLPITGAAAGTNMLSIDGAGSMLIDTSNFIAGRGTAAAVTVTNGASLSVAGALLVAGNGGADRFAASLGISGGTVSAASGTVYGLGSVTLGLGSLTLTGGGTLTLLNGASLVGSGIVSGNIVDSATITARGSLTLSGGTLSGTGGLGALVNSNLRIADTTPFSNAITFGGANATVALAAPATYTGTISGLALTDTIDLPNQAPTGAQPVYAGSTVSYAGDVFNVGTGYTAADFQAVPDTAGGSNIVYQAACFCDGTAILTAAGEIPVEHLRVGDLVATMTGLRPVRWIGRTTIDLDRHPDPQSATPIRIAAHAVSPGMPHRDLLVSPDHALALDGALIPAHLLVNDATIRREPAHGLVAYWHVELDRHAVLLAQGLPAESYLDTGNRGDFAGQSGSRRLHPDLTADAGMRNAAVWDHAACGLLLLGGARVVAMWRSLEARGSALGYGSSDDPALTIEVRCRPLPTTGHNPITASLPPGTRHVRLRSRSMIPVDRDRTQSDRRRLGVAVTGIRLDGTELDLSDPALLGGFHAPEAHGGLSWRWTDGEGLLTVPPKQQPTILTLEIASGWQRYQAQPDACPDQEGRSAIA